MNFFEHQDVARKKTGTLVFYFILAVIAIVFSIYLAVVLILNQALEEAVLVRPFLFVSVLIGTAVLVGGGSLYKVSQLSSGGKVVAEMLGGRLVNFNTSDPAEKKLMNVVSEMAIASGVPLPEVYVMENEPGINAFAAGFSPSSAVIGVTRGAIDALTRDELQGVIAHEFSHILNGDMALNIRLIGILHGILMISLLGYWTFRITAEGSRGSRDNKGAGPIILLGIAFMIIGYVGVFFGNLIKAAVSRQREFLADASAVQFTRNPNGIGGALKKIGGLGSKVESPNASEASHMFFSTGISSLFATHPPIEERVSRIMNVDIETLARSSSPANVIENIGSPDAAQMGFARNMVASVSVETDPLGAVATVYALLLHDDAKIETEQLEWLKSHSDPGLFHEIARVRRAIKGEPREKRLPILDLELPTLRVLAASQKEEFLAGMQSLIDADQKLTLFEYALQKIVASALAERKERITNTKFSDIERDAILLLSATAHMGHFEPDRVTAGFTRGAAVLDVDAEIVPLSDCSFANLDRALEKLKASSGAIKQKVIESILACATVDNFITIEEFEMIRAIAATINVPIPPMIPSKP